MRPRASESGDRGRFLAANQMNVLEIVKLKLSARFIMSTEAAKMDALQAKIKELEALEASGASGSSKARGECRRCTRPHTPAAAHTGLCGSCDS